MLSGTGLNSVNRDAFYQKGNFIKIEIFPIKVLIFMIKRKVKPLHSSSVQLHFTYII